MRRRPPEPLLWLGVFDPPQRLAAGAVDELIAANMGGTARRGAVARVRFREAETTYRRRIARVKELIAAGDLYQLNYTFPVDLALDGDPLALYRSLRAAQPVAFGAYIDSGDWRVLSLSPELFVESRGGRLRTRPMKGTLARGHDLAEDDHRARALAADEKSRAENMMIVDLLRNDLSRIAEPGSVRVPALFEVERYPSVLQMTSTVTARRRGDCGLRELLAALFPCGSVTGAPKIRAIERIAERESAPRGIYTGAIGWFAPDGDLSLSVAIRTLVLDRGGAGRLGVGGGIVADSDAAAEYAECRLKARFLAVSDSAGDSADFDLIETLGWYPEEGYRRRPLHLERLARSARHFGFAGDMAGLPAMLDDAARDFSRPMLVRVLLARSGAVSITARPLQPWPEPLRLMVAERPVDSGDAGRRHKTTRRNWCRGPLAACGDRADEIIFRNERGEIVEGTRTNIFVEREGILLTPPLESGPLPGVLRQQLLTAGAACEAVLTLDDLRAAPRLYVGNSARGLMRARIIA
ncbi:MAG: aminodeoxychorismate synthase component I [Rhodothalassiaceae bacterium]